MTFERFWLLCMSIVLFTVGLPGKLENEFLTFGFFIAFVCWLGCIGYCLFRAVVELFEGHYGDKPPHG